MSQILSVGRMLSASVMWKAMGGDIKVREENTKVCPCYICYGERCWSNAVIIGVLTSQPSPRFLIYALRNPVSLSWVICSA